MPEGRHSITRPIHTWWFRRENIRRIDREAMERYAIPGAVLMENAAAALLEACLARLAPDATAPVLILCGPGNNGGDGFALARKLHNRRAPVSCAVGVPFDAYKGDAATNLAIAQRMGIPCLAINPADPAASLERLAPPREAPGLIVDALFGTGLDRPPRAPFSTLIAWINTRRVTSDVLAVDIPSGLDCDTGEPLSGPGSAVRAHVTVTLCGPKVGFRNPSAREYTGEVLVGDIGAPIELLERLAE